jgi:hypothetical protein
VGDKISARTPVPSDEAEDREEEGDWRSENNGNRYDSVFPVPVGDIATRSRDCKRTSF